MEHKYIPRLKERYIKEIVPILMKKYKYKNPLAVPKLVKIVINVGVGEGSSEPKLIELAMSELAQITGQKPIVTRAKQSIAAFKLRKNSPVGCMVTLRRNKMYEFLDRLIITALPRIRDFRGLSPNSFDKCGNYTIGIKEQIIFPEINYDKVEKTRGMNITLVTSTNNNELAKELLFNFGLPIRKD